MELDNTDIIRATMTAAIVAGSIHPDKHGTLVPHLTANAALGYADAILSQVQRHPAPVVTKAEPEMVPNPVKGLTVELPQIPGLDLELRGRRTIATMHQDYLKASEAAMVQAIKDQGAREERERIINRLVYGQGDPYIRAMECSKDGIHPIDAVTLGKILEPKP